MGVPRHYGNAFRGQVGSPDLDTTADILAAVGALVDCAQQLEHEPLKGAVSNATQQLVGQIEGNCRELVLHLLSPLANGESDDVAYDKLWTLRLMGKRSEVTRRWIMEAGGLAAISKVMAAHPTHEKLQKEGTWLVHVLCGLDGITELLRQSRGCAKVQEAVAWAISDLAAMQFERGQAGPSEWPQGDALVALLAEALRTQPASLDLLWACCSALRSLVQGQPCRSTIFARHGGTEGAIAALVVGKAAGDAGEKVLVAGMQLITALVDGNAAVAQELRSCHALEALVACGLSLPGKVTDETMWTLGQVGGILAVVEVMRQAPQESDAIRSGLAAMAKLSWMQLEEGLQLQYPKVAEALCDIAVRLFRNGTGGDMAEHAMQALGGVLTVLAPHVAPGSWPVADDGVELLIEAVGSSADSLVAQAAVASIGHIAARAPAWRAPLQRARGAIVQRIRLTERAEDEVRESAKHQKNLFWASAVVAGLPVVLEEMRSQASSLPVQEAAISAIVDILDDHADIPVRSEGGGVDICEVPAAIATVAAAMRAHGSQPKLQGTGCYALALLHQALPLAAEVPPEATDVVLTALRRHPADYKVASGACMAMRAFLEPRTGEQTPEARNVLGQVVQVLRARDVGATLRRLLEDFVQTRDKRMLEDALYVLGLVDGLAAVIRVLQSSYNANLGLRSAGMQALFELARTFPDLLDSRQVAEELHAVVNALVAEVCAAEAADAAAAAALQTGSAPDGVRGPAAGPPEPGEESSECVELARRAALVCGLLEAFARPQP